MPIFEPRARSKIRNKRNFCEEGIVTYWCLIEIGYLVSPLEDSSYFAFKIPEVLIHTSLVLKIPSYFDEYRASAKIKDSATNQTFLLPNA